MNPFVKDWTTPMTEAAYRREHNRLWTQAKRENNRWKMWNDRAHRTGFKNWDALDNAWHRSVDAGNAVAHFERTASVRGGWAVAA